MEPSQGRHSALATAKIVAEATGHSVVQIGVTTSRTPFGPEKLGLLAGPRHRHDRPTPIDAWHRAAGAKMIPAGIWWRPLYNGPSPDAVAAEARSEGVGMLDVSMLGKLAVRSPDGGALLDRNYTMAHETQPVGRVPYCLMLNDMARSSTTAWPGAWRQRSSTSPPPPARWTGCFPRWAC